MTFEQYLVNTDKTLEYHSDMLFGRGAGSIYRKQTYETALPVICACPGCYSLFL